MRRYRAELKQNCILCFLYCVRCGDGTRVLYEGSKSQCDAVATELETAFRDGEFVATSAQEARVRELEEALRSILGWRELRSGAGEIPIVRIEEIAREALSATAREG